MANAEDEEERAIFESQIKTALYIRAMFNSLTPGEIIKLVDGGTDATIQPYIKKVEEAHD